VTTSSDADYVFARVSFEVTNILGTLTFDQELDLAALEQDLGEFDEISGIKYKPSDNHWLQTRFGDDETYIAFYRTGKCAIAGPNSLDEFQRTSEMVVNVMESMLDKEMDVTPKIENIVATDTVGDSVNLETLAIALGLERCEYEPEQFPSLIYRGDSYTMLVFSNGKFVCTGLTDLATVNSVTTEFKKEVRDVLP
jgi:transcription initiation factor TFIID TATA-box-binding protein